VLREVADADLPAHFEQQRDPESARLAAKAPRDADAFARHWARIRADPAVVLRTIEADGEVAGSALSFVLEERRQVGYWIGRSHWGRGIATEALRQLLRLVAERPLQARVAPGNAASARVLEKCGFRLAGTASRRARDGRDDETLHVFELD
jgi:RimJ/RimL family protein N-acetyltransferase